MRRLGINAVLAVAFAMAGLAAAPAANAGVLLASASSCQDTVLERPFARWLDPLWYELVPDGGFERGGEGWSLSGARVVAGNEPFYVRATGDSRSLSLPPGSVATSPVLCTRIDKPVMRFFARSSKGLLSLSALSVELLFETAAGDVGSAPVGVVLPSKRWQPTLPLPVLASLLALLPNEETPIAFRFRPIGSATWTIDDVYLDPGRR